MDDRDRQELAKKLDAELELFMEELAKKKVRSRDATCTTAT